MLKKKLDKGLYITSDRCVWYKPEETVVIADLHLGHESSLADQGTTVPRMQKDMIIDALSTIIDRYEPRSLVVAGDFKHEFGRNRRQEFKEIYEVMDFLRERTSLVVVRGNHDNFLKTITSSAGVPFYEKMLKIGPFLISHGHVEVVKEGNLIIGHEHPSIKIRDEMSATLKRPCFLYHPSGVVVLPAFSPLAYGRDIIRARKFISKALENLSPEEFSVYMVGEDGLVDFCTVRDIKKAILDVQ